MARSGWVKSNKLPTSLDVILSAFWTTLAPPPSRHTASSIAEFRRSLRGWSPLDPVDGDPDHGGNLRNFARKIEARASLVTSNACFIKRPQTACLGRVGDGFCQHDRGVWAPHIPRPTSSRAGSRRTRDLDVVARLPGIPFRVHLSL